MSNGEEENCVDQIYISIFRANQMGPSSGERPHLYHSLERHFSSNMAFVLQMGNPFVDIEISINNDKFLWSHGLILDETYQLAQSICNNSKRWMESYVLDNLSENCYNVFNKVKSETGNINLEDVTLGSCSIVGGSQTTRSGKLGKVQ